MADLRAPPMTVAPTEIRRLVLEESRRANVGHIGSTLSVADILAALYRRVLRIPSPDDPERDRFLLAKGHAALALYAALHLRSWLTRDELATYCGDGSLLGVHPEYALAGVDSPLVCSARGCRSAWAPRWPRGFRAPRAGSTC